jgi:hypothetical protein
MNGLDIDLKKVDIFLVQADGPENLKTTTSDEKQIKVWTEAIELVRKSEAPVKYLRFYHNGSVYKLYPIEDSEEFRFSISPILN